MSDTNQAHGIDAGDDDAAFEAGFASVHGSRARWQRAFRAVRALLTTTAQKSALTSSYTAMQRRQQSSNSPNRKRSRSLDGLHPKVREALAELEQLRCQPTASTAFEGIDWRPAIT